MVFLLSACAERKAPVVSLASHIQETQIVVRGKGPAKWHYFDYKLPIAGSATLRLSNGARTNAPSSDRVEGAEVTLRGEGVVTPKEFNQQVDVLEVPVKLEAGTNRLGVRLRADSGQRVSVRIDAPADELVLAPVPNAVVLNGESLRARATVTALGQPVRGAEVRFEVLELGQTVPRRAATSDAGIATAFLSGFDAGEGELQARLTGTDLTDAVPITVLAKRTLSMRQRPESIRLEAGSGRVLGLAIKLREVQGDQDVVTLKHDVLPVSGGDPGGVLVRNSFPSQGEVVKEPKDISASPIVTAISPGRYNVTTTVEVADKSGAKVRESFSTELSVVVVPKGSPDPLRLSAPLISPSGIAPGSKRVVTFRTLLAGVSRPPQVLLLDRVSKRGEFIAHETELRDDGKMPDPKAGDRFYSGRLELGSEEEAEFYFRLRTEYLGKTVTSGIAVLPITRLPLGSRPSTGPLVENPNGQDRIFANEVVVGSLAGVSPRRVQSIVAEVGKSLGLEESGAIRIEGYIPSLDSYLVEFDIEGGGSLDGVRRVTSAFLAYAEVKYASPSIQGRLADDWWLDKIHVVQLRSRMAPSDPPVLPVYGSSNIGVAIIDNGVNCTEPDTDLNGKCADAGTWGIEGSCLDIYNTSSLPSTHGTRVAALVAGEQGAPPVIQGVDEGVAWGVTLLPFDIAGRQQHGVAAAMDCAVTAGALILNVSWEGDECISDDGGPCLNPETAPPEARPLLKDAVCNAICNSRLVVAAAGNGACPTPAIPAGYRPRFPASYNGATVDYDHPAPDCGCAIATGDRMLKVGGTDMEDAEGASKNADGYECVEPPYKKSQLGEIYAPGWGVGDGTGYGPNGTSWSAALVSGCAAVRAAVQDAKGKSWDPEKVEMRLRDTSVEMADPVRLMDCWTAVADQYDIVFVLDRSGSMSLPTENSPTRWGALTEAVNGLMPLIYATASPDSKFGLSLFATQAFDDTTADFQYIHSDFYTDLFKIDIDIDEDGHPDLSDMVQAELEGQSPLGLTAMGAGLIDGLGKARDTFSPRTRVVVLFTDGEENQVPFVKREDDETEVGCVLSDGTTQINPPPCPVDEASAPDESVKIITVGILGPDSSYLDTLQALAQKNRGNAIITSDGATFSGEGLTVDMDTLQDAFAFAIAPALAENSPQVVASYKGTLSEMVTLPAFELNKYVRQLLIKIAFSLKLKNRELRPNLAADVRITKDGADITRFFEPIFPSGSTDSVLLRTTFVHHGDNKVSTIPPEGSYMVHMPALIQEDSNVGYGVVAYADDHLLDMDWQISPVAPRAHQPFNPTISLRWRGNPVTNAHVVAKILKPGDDMGDLLAKHPKKIEPSGAPDAGSPGYQKYLHLREKDPDFLAQLQPNEEVLVLDHRGDGRYSAAYNPGNVSGVYQILYRVSAEDAELGKIQRLAVQSVYTRFGDIDLDQSAVSSTVHGKKVTINFRPVTAYGRFIGPAQGSAFTVDGAGISLSSVTDHQDGSYTLVLAGNPDAHVSIKLLGDEFYQGLASAIDPVWFTQLLIWLESLSLSSWLLWLVIVLILLLLVWLVWRWIVGKSSP